jgi:hypothetical protein
VKRLGSSSYSSRSKINLAKKILLRQLRTVTPVQQAIASILAFFAYGQLPAWSQSANGFGQAVDQVKSNAIVTSAGQSATDLMTFPFVIVGIVLLLVVLLGIVVGIAALFSGRDWATPFLNVFMMFAFILLGSAILTWLVASGIFGNGATAAAGGG